MAIDSTFPQKKVVLTKKLNNVLYELIVKTTSDMVYIEDTYTLTEKLSDIADKLLNINTRQDTFDNAFAQLLKDAPETFRTFKEVWDYVNINGDPESELIKLIKSKQDAEEGKGLSTHDLTDVLYEKLVNGYTKEELNAKFEIIAKNEDDLKQLIVNDIDELRKEFESELDTLKQQTTEKFNAISARVTTLETKPNIVVDDETPQIPDYSSWYQIVSVDDSEES